MAGLDPNLNMREIYQAIKDLHDIKQMLEGEILNKAGAAVKNVTKNLIDLSDKVLVAKKRGELSGKALDDFNKAVKEHNDALKEATKSTKKSTKEDYDYKAQTRKMERDYALKEIKRAFGEDNPISALLNGVAKYGKKIAYIGAIFGGLAYVSHKVTQALMQNLKSYNDLVEHGLRPSNDSFLQLGKMATAAGFTLEDLSTMVAKSSKAISVMGAGGVEKFAKMAGTTALTASKFGYSLNEATGYLSEYLERLRITGLLEQVDKQRQDKIADEYLENLTQFSQVMGKSRTEISKAVGDQMRDLDNKGFMASLEPGKKAAAMKSLTNIYGSIAATFEDAAPSMINSFKSVLTGVFTDPKTTALMNSFAPGMMRDMGEMRDRMLGGDTISASDAIEYQRRMKQRADLIPNAQLTTLRMAARAGNQAAAETLKMILDLKALTNEQLENAKKNMPTDQQAASMNLLMETLRQLGVAFHRFWYDIVGTSGFKRLLDVLKKQLGNEDSGLIGFLRRLSIRTGEFAESISKFITDLADGKDFQLTFIENFKPVIDKLVALFKPPIVAAMEFMGDVFKTTFSDLYDDLKLKFFMSDTGSPKTELEKAQRNLVDTRTNLAADPDNPTLIVEYAKLNEKISKLEYHLKHRTDRPKESRNKDDRESFEEWLDGVRKRDLLGIHGQITNQDTYWLGTRDAARSPRSLSNEQSRPERSRLPSERIFDALKDLTKDAYSWGNETSKNLMKPNESDSDRIIRERNERNRKTIDDERVRRRLLPGGIGATPMNYNPNDPRGIRLNNPGNMDRNNINWQGMAPDQPDKRFIKFDSPEMGLRAMAKNLITSQDKHGNQTVQDIIKRWAPPNENNTGAYVNAVSKSVGVNPNQRINVHDPKIMKPLMKAIIKHENGKNPYSDEQIDRGMEMAGIGSKLDQVVASNERVADQLAAMNRNMSKVKDYTQNLVHDA